MKNLILVTILAILLITAIAQPALANYKMEIGLPGITAEEREAGVNLGKYLENLFIFLIAVAGLAGMFFIIYGGFIYMMSGSNASKVTDAKDRIIAAISGLILVICSVVLLTFINPDLAFPKLPGMEGIIPVVVVGHGNATSGEGELCLQASPFSYDCSYDSSCENIQTYFEDADTDKVGADTKTYYESCGNNEACFKKYVARLGLDTDQTRKFRTDIKKATNKAGKGLSAIGICKAPTLTPDEKKHGLKDEKRLYNEECKKECIKNGVDNPAAEECNWCLPENDDGTCDATNKKTNGDSIACFDASNEGGVETRVRCRLASFTSDPDQSTSEKIYKCLASGVSRFCESSADCKVKNGKDLYCLPGSQRCENEMWCNRQYRSIKEEKEAYGEEVKKEELCKQIEEDGLCRSVGCTGGICEWNGMGFWHGAKCMPIGYDYQRACEAADGVLKETQQECTTHCSDDGTNVREFKGECCRCRDVSPSGEPLKLEGEECDPKAQPKECEPHLDCVGGTCSDFSSF